MNHFFEPNGLSPSAPLCPVRPFLWSVVAIGLALLPLRCLVAEGAQNVLPLPADGSTTVTLRLQPEWLWVAERSENRVRVHTRLRTDIPVSDDIHLVLGVTTGRRGDPRVPDVLYDEGSFGPAILRAAPLGVEWRCSEHPDVWVNLGRIEAPWWSVENLVLDPDWDPVGAAAHFEHRHGSVRTRAVASVISLVDMGRPDWRLYAAQAAAQWKPSPQWRLTSGVSALIHEQAEGERPLLSHRTAEGNTLRPTPAAPQEDSHLATNYHVLEGFTQAVWDPWMPVTFSAQYVINAAAARQREGWLVGIALGRSRAVGGWAVGWNYRRLQADATVSALADSEFGGGGTGLEGRRLYLSFHPVPRLWVTASWTDAYRNRRGPDLRDQRAQLDLTLQW